MSRKNTFFAFLCLALVGFSNLVFAASPINITGKHSVTFTVEDLSAATGFGMHFSSGPGENGYGGYYAECHFVSGSLTSPSDIITFLCYDGYKDTATNEAQNQFRMTLNDKSTLSHASITVGERSVTISVFRLSRNFYTTEKYVYSEQAVFPLRQETGFWRRGGSIYYSTNGVLNGDPGRPGSGYVLTSEVVR